MSRAFGVTVKGSVEIDAPRTSAASRRALAATRVGLRAFGGALAHFAQALGQPNPQAASALK